MAILADDLITGLGRRIGPLAPLIDIGSVVAWSLREMGFDTASVLSVTDADLAPVSNDDANELIDYCMYQAAEQVVEQLDEVQLRQIGVDESVDDLRKSWRLRVESYYKKLRDKYNYGLSTIVTGNIDLDFASRFDDVEEGGMQ